MHQACVSYICGHQHGRVLRWNGEVDIVGSTTRGPSQSTFDRPFIIFPFLNTYCTAAKKETELAPTPELFSLLSSPYVDYYYNLVATLRFTPSSKRYWYTSHDRNGNGTLRPTHPTINLAGKSEILRIRPKIGNKTNAQATHACVDLTDPLPTQCCFTTILSKYEDRTRRERRGWGGRLKNTENIF